MPVTHFALRGCPLEARVPWWRMTPFFVPEARGEEGSRHCASILAPGTQVIDAEEPHRPEMSPVRLASRERHRYSCFDSRERRRLEWSPAIGRFGIVRSGSGTSAHSGRS